MRQTATVTSHQLPAPPDSRRQLAVAPSRFESRDLIEGYVHRLNEAMPLAERRILSWGRDTAASLRVAAVAPPGDRQVFIGEAETSFDLEVRGQASAGPAAPYSVGLVLSGSMAVDLPGGRFVAGPGEGVIIDTARVERTLLTAGSHIVEFQLPKHTLLSLSAELRPGDLDGAPRFAPLLQAALVQRLLGMAALAGSALHAGRDAHSGQVLLRRWTEMIGLTLLDEHAPANSPARQLEAATPPARLRRALDFIDANAHRPIELADIAEAASISTSALLRQFQAHLGQSPGAFLRQVRLDRAREALQRGSAGTVREVALRWGFQNASKFSKAYQQRFGERPADSFRRR
jgi:AraC-like DNA-binding protein